MKSREDVDEQRTDWDKYEMELLFRREARDLENSRAANLEGIFTWFLIGKYRLLNLELHCN